MDESAEGLAFSHQAGQQRRRFPEIGVVHRVLRKTVHRLHHIEQAHLVGVVHRATTVDREAITHQVDHVDVAGFGGDAFFKNMSTFIDQ